MDERPWHAVYPDHVSTSIDYPDIPVHELLRQAALEDPDETALVFYGRRTSYDRLWEKVDRFARALHEAGLQPGDRVGVMLPNSPQFVVAFFATLKAGGVVVPTNPLYTAREVAYQWGDAGVDVGVTLDIFWDAVDGARGDLDLDTLVVGDVADELPLVKSLLYPLKKRSDYGKVDVPYGGDVRPWDEVIDVDRWRRSVDVTPAEDLAVLQYTGGTTGRPKGAKLTHRNLVSNAMADAMWLGSEKRSETFLSVIPFFHVYGLTAAMLFAIDLHCPQILHPDARDLDAILDLIDDHRPTIFPGVPALYQGLNEHEDVDSVDLSCLESCVSGSAPLPLEVMREFEERTGADIVEGYGLTEASPTTHVNPTDRVKPGTIGVPLPDTDAKVVDLETGEEEQPTGEPGELIVSGPQIMQGYWDRSKETEATLRDGWLYTGDVATVDEEGYFAIVDRKKDMILASGFNVYPREVEEVLYEHDDVVEAAIFGVPDEKRGENVAAAIVLRDGADVGEDALEAYCRENLTAYKVPKIWRFMDELPRSTVRKVLKRKLRDMVTGEEE